MPINYSEAKKLLKKNGQEQILAYYDELDEADKKQLIAQIESIDFSAVRLQGTVAERDLGKLYPLPVLTVGEIEKNRAGYESCGIAALKAGKVAAVLLAGGQGTRLGSDNPKGMFDIGITRELTIFGQQFENILRVVAECGAYFHIFIMTSLVNNEKTVDFFKNKNFFGYPSDKVHFFVQEMAPTCDLCGKIYLEEKGRISMSPNGNGGWYSSLISSDAGKIVRDEGIEWLNVYSVDNVLQRICDPVFIGATLGSGCNCSSKVVKKVSADERVGVLCLEDGRPAIVEYYEMPPEKAAMRDENGELVFAYGVTLNYLFKVEVLDKTIKQKLPVHLSLKKIPHIENGVKVNPEKPNGYKFEILVLDMINLMDSCLAVEVVREREFAPVKNRTGADSVDTARRLLELNGVKL